MELSLSAAYSYIDGFLSRRISNIYDIFFEIFFIIVTNYNIFSFFLWKKLKFQKINFINNICKYIYIYIELKMSDIIDE